MNLKTLIKFIFVDVLSYITTVRIERFTHRGAIHIEKENT